MQIIFPQILGGGRPRWTKKNGMEKHVSTPNDLEYFALKL